jgi:hypothetical protein
MLQVRPPLRVAQQLHWLQQYQVVCELLELPCTTVHVWSCGHWPVFKSNTTYEADWRHDSGGVGWLGELLRTLVLCNLRTI